MVAFVLCPSKLNADSDECRSGRNECTSGRNASWAKLVMGETRGYLLYNFCSSWNLPTRTNSSRLFFSLMVWRTTNTCKRARENCSSKGRWFRAHLRALWSFRLEKYRLQELAKSASTYRIEFRLKHNDYSYTGWPIDKSLAILATCTTPALHLLSRLELNQTTALFLFLTVGEGHAML